VLILALAIAGFFIELQFFLVYDFNTQSPPVAPLGTLMLVVLANTALARFGRGLSRKELLVIYCMVTVGAPLIAHGTLLWMLCTTISQRELAYTMTDWPNAFFQYIPSWFAPSHPDAVDGFFRGESAVPWALWLKPLLLWGLLFLALYVANLCLLVILRRQWVTHERLSFPVALVPLEAVRDGDRGVGRLSRSSALWIGFGVVFVLLLEERLATLMPWLPSIPATADIIVVPWQRVGPLAGIGDFTISFWPTGLGLAYLIPKELSFSVWFFWYLRVAQTVAAIAAGVTPMRPQDYWGTEFPAPYYQGAGAVLALGVLVLWSARHYLAQAVRLSLRGESEDDIILPLGHRLAMLGLGLAVTYILGFCLAAGMRVGVALVLVTLVLTFHMVWARLRAENGMSFIGFPYSAGALMTDPLGTAILRPRDVVTTNALSWTYWPGWGEGSEVITGATLDALKISSAARIAQRPLLLAMAGAFVFALIVGCAIILKGTYHRGFWNYDLLYSSWMIPGMRNQGQGNYDAVMHPTGVNLGATAAVGGGMAFTLLLGVMRTRFWWWPFHPVGYLAANVWGTQSWWCPMFIGWLVKTLVIRYGGLRLYQRTMPAAIGMILANQLIHFLWPVVMALAR